MNPTANPPESNHRGYDEVEEQFHSKKQDHNSLKLIGHPRVLEAGPVRKETRMFPHVVASASPLTFGTSAVKRGLVAPAISVLSRQCSLVNLFEGR